MHTTFIKKSISWWDWTGIFFSSLCLVHCIATPILLASASLWFSSEWIHVGFLVALIPITTVAVRRSCSLQRNPLIAYFLYAGLAVLGAGLVLGETIGEGFEIWTTIIGSMLLIFGHLKNRRLHSEYR